MKHFFTWALKEEEPKVIETNFLNNLTFYGDTVTIIRCGIRVSYNMETGTKEEVPPKTDAEKQLISLGMAPCLSLGLCEYYMGGTRVFQIFDRRALGSAETATQLDNVFHNPHLRTISLRGGNYYYEWRPKEMVSFSFSRNVWPATGYNRFVILSRTELDYLHAEQGVPFDTRKGVALEVLPESILSFVV
jgi:hypothetical protein